jgi:ankyrin repeat protein
VKSQLIAIVAAVLLVGCGGPSVDIWTAAAQGNIESVKRHLDAGVDVNAKNKAEMTPLHYASMMGHKEVAGMLITNGADVNAKDKDDFTSFHCAAAFGHKETAELLLRSITIASRDWGRYCAALPDSR